TVSGGAGAEIRHRLAGHVPCEIRDGKNRFRLRPVLCVQIDFQATAGALPVFTGRFSGITRSLVSPPKGVYYAAILSRPDGKHTDVPVPGAQCLGLPGIARKPNR